MSRKFWIGVAVGATVVVAAIAAVAGFALAPIVAPPSIGGVIAGTVHSGDLEVEGLPVELYSEGRSLRITHSNANGAFQFAGLADAAYTIRFGDDGFDIWSDGWWSGADAAADADPIEIVGAASVTDIRIEVLPAGSISGTVISWPGANPQLRVFDESGAEVGIAYTDEDGSYEFQGLSPGSYRLRAEATDSETPSTAWWGGGSTFETAGTIAVAAGEAVTDLIITLAPTP